MSKPETPAGAKALSEGEKYMRLLEELGPEHPTNTSRYAIAARIAFKCREMTYRLPPKPGYVPTGYESEADHQSEHKKLMPALIARRIKGREDARRADAKAHPTGTPLSTLQSRRVDAERREQRGEPDEPKNPPE